MVPGSAVTDALVARNPGPANATGVPVASSLAAQLQGVNWTYLAAGGGTCAAAGTGNVADTVNLPAGASVTYTLAGTVAPLPTPGNAASTAGPAPPVGFKDPATANHSATAVTAIRATAEVPRPQPGHWR